MQTGGAGVLAGSSEWWQRAVCHSSDLIFLSRDGAWLHSERSIAPAPLPSLFLCICRTKEVGRLKEDRNGRVGAWQARKSVFAAEETGIQELCTKVAGRSLF